MSHSRPRTIGIVSMAVVSLACSLAFSAVLSRPANARGLFVGHRFDSSAAEMRTFWTRARMRSAAPMPAPNEQTETLTVAETDGWNSKFRSSEAGALATSVDTEGSFKRSEVDDPSVAPYRSHGKLFVTAGRATYACSATVVDSANESVVMTAAHCLYGDDIGGWVDSIAFVPGYESGNRPYGTWAAESAFVTPAWISDETARGDVGAIVIKPLYGSSIVDEVGGRAIAFGESREQIFESFGYPAEAPFDGQHLYVCSDDEVLRDENPGGTGPDTMGIGCDMTGGSSGGGWIINGTTLNSVNSYGYEDQAGNALPFMFGPYFGTMAEDVFAKAEAVAVDLPEPLPSEVPTDVPTTVPTDVPTSVPTDSPTPPVDPRGATVEDADDSRGLFDISSVTASVSEGRVEIDLTTYEEWGPRLLSAAHPRNAFYVDFDSLGGVREDFYLTVFSRNGRLVGRVFRYGPGRDLMVGRALLSRSSRNGFTAVVNGDSIDLVSTLGWYATSTFKSNSRCRTACTDYAPNRSMVEI